ncbi:MAG: HepT-like ribonuclease domain-containing protein [Xanthobacteraceae bacterium]
MPPTVEDRLRDILEAITEIEEMLEGSSLDQFTADKMRRMATERYIEVICEAARTIPAEIKQDNASIDWRKMVDFGNLLRHAYHTTNPEIVWGIVQDHLPPLKSFVERHMRASGG